jgi:GrpB-like predicted nucleotidyltransferase (UPF0157 family)
MKNPSSSSPKEEIKLVPYRWEWEKQYARERKNLEKEIGEHILDIQHVGSTAVPEMSARPVIDILIGIDDLSGLSGFEDILDQMGYRRYDPESGSGSEKGAEPGCVLFEAGGRQSFTLRFVGARSLKDQPHTRFRDMLIADPKLAKDYKETKIWLVRKHPMDHRKYSEEKGRWIQGVLKR